MNTDNYAVMLLENEVLDMSLKKYASKIVTQISNLTEDNFLDTELLAYRLAASVKSIVDLLRQKTNTEIYLSDSSCITEYNSDSVNELTNSKVERKFIIDLCNLIKYRCKGIKSNKEYYEKMKPLSEFLSLPLEKNFNIEKYSYIFFYIFLQLFSLKYIGYSERRYEEYLCDYSIYNRPCMYANTIFVASGGKSNFVLFSF